MIMIFKEDTIMALSLDSKIRDIMRSPEGKAVMEKYAPGSSTDPRMKLVGALTYRKLLSYPESAEVAKLADQIDEDLKKCSR
jgi:hypothetical protein